MAATQWIVVTGVVQPGHRVASGQGGDARYPDETLRLQFPKFAALGLDLTGVLAATLNVSIQPRRWIMQKKFKGQVPLSHSSSLRIFTSAYAC